MSESKMCDYTSVGVIVRNPRNEIAVIKRKNFPVAYALPAGHCDGDLPRQAAIREAKEEIGVEVISLRKLLEANFLNPCRREDGTHHNWHIFEAAEWRGTPRAGNDAQELIWLPGSDIVAYASRTWSITKKYELDGPQSHAHLVHLLDKDRDWRRDPGLELVWCIMLARIGMITTPLN